LLPPKQGKVAWKGRHWEEMSTDEFNSELEKIRHVPAESQWITQLSLRENITLAQRHHSTRPDQEISQEADAWARRFGLTLEWDPFPRMLGREDLRKAALIRAFLGKPELLILEEPTREMAEIIPALWHAIEEVRERGAAVIWITSEESVWNQFKEKAKVTARVESERLEVVHGEKI
jgi:phospholipid/cholesterol/gamma-HCH transport system ATP-binding protein